MCNLREYVPDFSLWDRTLSDIRLSFPTGHYFYFPVTSDKGRF